MSLYSKIVLVVALASLGLAIANFVIHEWLLGLWMFIAAMWMANAVCLREDKDRLRRTNEHLGNIINKKQGG